MRRTISGFTLIASLATACSHGPTVARTTPSSSLSASATASPSVHLPSKRATAVLYGKDSEIWIYDVASDGRRRIFAGKGAFLSVWRPRFESASLLSFTTNKTDAPGTVDALWELPRAGGTPRKLFDAPGYIATYAWSPGRTAVAFVSTTAKGDDILYVWRRGVGVSKVRHLGTVVGRDGVDREEVTVQWSPDGERVLAVDTTVDLGSHSTMFVVRHGADVVNARNGAQAVWSPDGAKIYYCSWTAPYDWRALDVATNTEERLGAQPNGVRASLSPDGARIAYNGIGNDPAVHVYSLATHEDRKLASDGAGAIWLGAGELAFTDTKPCTPNGNCEGAWLAAGTVSAIDVSGRRRHLALPTTLGVDVLYA